MEKGKVSGMLWKNVGERDLVAVVPRGKLSCLLFDGQSCQGAAGESVEGCERENG